MKKTLLFIMAFVLSGFALFAQKHTEIKLKAKSDEFKVNDRYENGFSIQSNISKLILNQLETKSGQFQQLTIEGLVKTYNAGSPELPVYSKLIEIPQNAKVTVEVISYEEEIINLVDYGINQQIIPAQHSISKSDDPAKIPFIFDEEIYKTDRFINEKTVIFEEAGMMRATRLGRLEISPIQYNPSTNQIRILNNLVINVLFDGANMAKTNELKAKYYSPVFSTEGYTINALPLAKEFITDEPITLVIVSDPMFQTQLQEFIAWKKLKGFHVIEAYTNNPSVGTTNASIKAYLAGLYNTPPQGVNAPSYVLFVGDVQQIPAWNSSSKNDDETKVNYITDLRYCEYTNDDIPEVYYGRFSAQNTTQLQPQIDKTLMYEKYTMSDPSYLEKSMLVAGVDGSFAPTYGNGAINYAATYYVNEDHYVDPLTYLYNNAASSTVMASNNSGASSSIVSYMSQGLGFANYTAHCGSDGWSDPSFTSSHVGSLTNNEKYGLWIGNCCQSLMFGYDACFGEAGLRKANGGAIGIIGGSQSTYWDEDYWWAIGLTSSISANPTYTNSALGVYDGIYHDGANELNNQGRWYIAQGQLNLCGNLAVQASSSTRKRYYWEIYHLMGDPTLIPYLRIPDANTPVCSPSVLMLGMTELTVNTAPYATVALSQNGVLVDVKIANNIGAANLSFQNTAITVGNCDLVITGQNLQPYIGTIEVIPSNSPYVVLHNFTISDVAGNNNNQADYGESITLNIDLKNVAAVGSGYNALNVVAELSTTDSYITITDNSQTFGSINAGSVASQANAYALTIANNIPDQHRFNLSLAITGNDNTKQNYTWNGNISFLGNAPVLTLGEILIDDESGNDDGILDPLETANIKISLTNTGHANISAITALMELAEVTTLLTINDGDFNVAQLNVNANAELIFNVTASDAPLGTPVNVVISAEGGEYETIETKTIIIGLVPIFIMGSEASVTACVGEFYDMGGPNGVYSANIASQVMTFYPASSGKILNFQFTMFDLESNTGCTYDYLEVYNGPNTSAPLIGHFCGSSVPTELVNFVALNPTGSVTFKFKSDGTQQKAGWAATFLCIPAPAPVANFIGTPTSLYEGSVVQFTDMSENLPETWSWTITPGTEGVNFVYVNSTSATSQNPSVKFLEAGVYSISLTASNSNGNNTMTKTNYITVIDVTTEPEADFQSNVTAVSIGGIISFTDLSTQTPTSWNWEFTPSDGIEFVNSTSATSQNPQVKFNNPGFYTVKLTATNSFGSGVEEKNNYIEIIEELTIGTGTENSIYYPFYNYFKANKSQMLYKNSELDGEFVIKTVSFNINYVTPTQQHRELANFVIKIKHSSSTSFGEAYEDMTNATTVFTSTSYTMPADTGWHTWDITDFAYDGTSNLIIEVSWGETSSYAPYGTAYKVYGTDYPNEYLVVYGYQDAAPPVTYDGRSTIRPNIKINTPLNAFPVVFTVYNSLLTNVPIENATVTLGTFGSSSTNNQGVVTFSNIPPANSIPYTVSAQGFNNFSSVINVTGNTNEIIYISPVLSNNDISAGEVMIYPNPSNGKINIRLAETNSKAKVNIYSIQGQLIYSGLISNQSAEINLNNAKGIYILEIKSERINTRKHLIIE